MLAAALRASPVGPPDPFQVIHLSRISASTRAGSGLAENTAQRRLLGGPLRLPGLALAPFSAVMRKLWFPFWLAGVRLRRSGGPLVLVVLGLAAAAAMLAAVLAGTTAAEDREVARQVSATARQGAVGSRQLVQRRRPGRAVPDPRHDRPPAARARAPGARDRHVALPRSTSSAVRCSASARSTTSAVGCTCARAVCRASAGRSTARCSSSVAAGRSRTCRGCGSCPSARASLRTSTLFGDAIPAQDLRRVGLRREDPPLPPARAAAARARERRRRARPLAGAARRLPQLRLGRAARSWHGALVVGRGVWRRESSRRAPPSRARASASS